MNKRTWNSIIVGIVLGVVAACADTSGGGGESETNWLKTCTTDADCTVGSCLCGVCTKACTPGGSCTNGPPESECVASASATECSGFSSPPSGVCLPPREAGTGTGGANGGSGGTGTGGRATGGRNAGGAGPGGGPAATGGAANGGTGGRSGSGNTGGRSHDGGPVDAADAGCVEPKALIYLKPGCDQLPVCEVPDNDACASIYCDCNGQTVSTGCGFSRVRFRHGGNCTDADIPPVIGALDASTLP